MPPTLPPRGVFLSTRLIYHFDLPDHLFKTWVQLRGLAWRSDVTPPLSMTEISSLTGRPQASLYRHMAQLKELGALNWRTNRSGALIVSFASDLLGAKSDPSTPQPPPMPNFATPPEASILVRDSQNQESAMRNAEPDSHRREADSHERESSLNTSDHAEYKIKESDHVFSDPLFSSDPIHLEPDQNILDHEDLISSPSNIINPSDINGDNEMMVKEINITKPTDHHESPGGEREYEGERGRLAIERSNVGTLERVKASPQSIYTALTGVIPTPNQVIRMELRVKDPDVWSDSIQHWLSHHWNPKNLAMLLELYDRGGAKGCFFCAHGNHPRGTIFSSSEPHAENRPEEP